MPTDDGPTDLWRGDFGEQWTERNSRPVVEIDADYEEKYGVTRTDLNESFVGDIDRDARVLEIGVNAGAQLRVLQSMGFSNLYGVDITEYAVRRAREDLPDTEFALADARRLPFADATFDLVFTSGVLIHLPPSQLPETVSEIARVSAHYVWGFEYYADESTQINYRGHDDFLWKDNFAARYEEATDLDLVQKKRVPYLGTDNEDEMFLLERPS